MNDRSIPRVALLLGLAGVIPFIASAALSLSADMSDAGLQALAAYAAVILSFLGGVRWGVLLTEPGRFDTFGAAIISVLPSILAWLALLLTTVPMLVLLLAGLVLQYLIDSPVSPLKTGSDFLQWYPRLRLLLSTGAIVCVSVGLYGAM